MVVLAESECVLNQANLSGEGIASGPIIIIIKKIVCGA
jgi:hypothetical protein